MKFILKRFGKVIKEMQLEEGREYIIGRHSDCDFVLDEETGFSRKHVKIHQSPESGNWLVESISELGGLYLEGEEVDGAELEDSASLALKSYTLEFIAEKEENEPEKTESQTPQSPAPTLKKEEEENLEGQTKVFFSENLVYSLYIYIDGEMSNHLSLNEGDSWVIGRSEECDISVDYSVLTRKHLKITKQAENFYVQDLGSANKTFLNGEELKAGQPFPLRANDEISISDLKIVFEVRDRHFKQMMSNLPVLSQDDSQDEGGLPALASAKVILEDAPEDGARPAGSLKRKGINKKIIFLFIVLAVAGAVVFIQLKSDKKAKVQQAKQKKDKEYKDKLEAFYKEALNSLEKEKYHICIDQLEELHRFSTQGGFKDSQQILLRCQNGLENRKQKEEYLRQEEAKRQTEEKIKEIVDECKKQYAAGAIKTQEDLAQCSQELASLDPLNADISAIKLEIMEKENLRQMEEQKKLAFRQLIQSKKALYNRAKKLHDQNKDLPAISAYNVFLRATKKMRSLQSLRDQAQSARDSLQNKYDEELNRFYTACESKVKNNKMKEAYYACKKFLEFKEDDKRAVEFMGVAKKTLQNKLKPIYEKSMAEESFAKIDEAKRLWSEILDTDIKEGYYYKKAQHHIKKYK